MSTDTKESLFFSQGPLDSNHFKYILRKEGKEVSQKARTHSILVRYSDCHSVAQCLRMLLVSNKEELTKEQLSTITIGVCNFQSRLGPD